MNAESKTGYAPIHGMQLYYEIHGQGKPMVLLHGGITAFEGFGTNIDALAKSRQVIAVHLQGHGNTADIDRPYSCEALADDVAALVAYLKLGKLTWSATHSVEVSHCKLLYDIPKSSITWW